MEGVAPGYKGTAPGLQRGATWVAEVVVEGRGVGTKSKDSSGAAACTSNYTSRNNIQLGVKLQHCYLTQRLLNESELSLKARLSKHTS